MKAHSRSAATKSKRTLLILLMLWPFSGLVGCGTIKEMTNTALYDLQQLRSPTALPAPPRQSFTGTLSLVDRQLPTYEFMDEYRIVARSGQILVVQMEATAFDPYVIVVAPSGYQLENDEHQNRQITAAIDWELSEDGEYRIIATSDEARQRGRYTLDIRLIDPEDRR